MPTPKQILEAVLFASDAPVGIQVLTELTGQSAPSADAVAAAAAQDAEAPEPGTVLRVG